jgi:hypothetical protein
MGLYNINPNDGDFFWDHFFLFRGCTDIGRHGFTPLVFLIQGHVHGFRQPGIL